MSRNPLQSDPALTSSNPLQTPPTWADAWDYNAPVVQQHLSDAWQTAQDPKFWTEAAKQWADAMVAGTATPGSVLRLPIRMPSEDVGATINAQYNFGRSVGPRVVPIESLNGGVALNDPVQAARVAALKTQMVGPNGYISRPIVDTEGNVIEGQHRLEALRQLGVKTVPVHVIQDLGANVNEAALQKAAKDAQPMMHGDQRTQLIGHVLGAVADEGSPSAVRDLYEPPNGYGPAWNAALDFLENSAK